MSMRFVELDISDVECLRFFAKEQVIFRDGSAFTG
jgi:hypothetical protein